MQNNSSDRQQTVRALLALVLSDAVALTGMGAADLDLTIRTARHARLLGRLALELEERGSFGMLPQVAQDQLQSALVHADSRARLAMWELDRIAWALSDWPELSPIAMKGCTYLLLGTSNAAGRFFADVDLMVPEEQLEELEEHLNERGWKSAQLSPYDQNYYRSWTHELPPLMHLEREVEIDLHHNILPRTARLKPRSELLLESARPVPGSRYRVLCNEDIVLHAITHLMFGDDMADKLRDLVDIRDLLLHFSSADERFWSSFVERAERLDLRRPTFYALRYAHTLLDLAIPCEVSKATATWGPPRPITSLMDSLVPRALFPQHPDYPSRLTILCRTLLYIRSHWIRMPPWLLAYHLTYKFYLTRIRRVPKIQA